MNIGWVNPPEKITAGIQIRTPIIAVKIRPVSRMDSGGTSRART